ncbi:protein kinase domain containing protein [Plasmodium gonderi]|uniref:Protein kinase domain containing protein n=1 Tax=Plasmodium gonderi TaxID=77519 RepID=A0A1Y1J9Y4_PLAGO|nr:protein kinase domain containing protein [Plasmodium gonderi]GAW79321.1 protein kinase domain containing protein [Plasmodium gonderi]
MERDTSDENKEDNMKDNSNNSNNGSNRSSGNDNTKSNNSESRKSSSNENSKSSSSGRSKSSSNGSSNSCSNGSSKNSSNDKIDGNYFCDRSPSNCNEGDVLDSRNEFNINNADPGNCEKIQRDNIKCTYANNPQWSYDNKVFRQNYDVISSNEINANNVNMCFPNNGIMNYQHKMNDGNNNLIIQSHMGYLDSNTPNSNNVYNLSKVYNELNSFAIRTSTTDNNLLNMNSTYFNNAMKCSDYNNYNNCIYHSGMLNTSASENQKNNSNNSSPYKSDYLKFNLNSLNSIYNNLNFSNISNSNNVNYNIFNSNVTTPVLDPMNYNMVNNSCNVKYTSNMFDFTPTENVNSLKAKDFNINHSNKAFFQESDLSNYSYRNLKNGNLLSNYPTPVYNVVSNNVDPGRYISSNNSKYSNKNNLNINVLNCKDSNLPKEQMNALVLSDPGIFCKYKAEMLARGNANYEEGMTRKRVDKSNREGTFVRDEKLEQIEKSEREQERENDLNIRKDERRDKKKKIAHLMRNHSSTQKKKHKSKGNSLNRDTECVNSKEVFFHQNKEDCYGGDKLRENYHISGRKKDSKKDNFGVLITKNHNSRKSLTNENQLLMGKEQKFDFKKDKNECSYKKVEKEISSKNSSKNQIVVNKRNSQVLTNIMNFQGPEKYIEDDMDPHKKKNSAKYIKDDKNPDITKSNTIKDRLRSRTGKEHIEKNKLLHENLNGKNLSKYDFLMSRNIHINNVTIENKKEGKKKVTLMKNCEEKNHNSTQIQNNNLTEKKRKHKDINQNKNTVKDDQIAIVLRKSEKKMKKFEDTPKLDNNRMLNIVENGAKKGDYKSKKNEKLRENEAQVDKEKTGENRNCTKSLKREQENVSNQVKGEVEKEVDHVGKREYDKKNETDVLKMENHKQDDKNTEQMKINEKEKKIRKEKNDTHVPEQKNSLFHKMKKKNSVEGTDKTKEGESIGSNLDKEDKNKEFLQGNFSEKQTTDAEEIIPIKEINTTISSSEGAHEQKEDPLQANFPQKEISILKESNNETDKPVNHTRHENKIIIQMKESSKGEDEMIANDKKMLTKEGDAFLGSAEEDIFLDVLEENSTKEDIIIKKKEELNDNKPCDIKKSFIDEEKKKRVKDIMNLRLNAYASDENPVNNVAEYVEIQNNEDADIKKKISDEKTNIMDEKEDAIDKDSYKITKSVIYPNDTSNAHVNYKKKNSVKDVAIDLNSSSAEKDYLINNEKKKLWSNLGYISYVDNFVGKGSYGSVRKALYNVDHNSKDLKFYIDKINSLEFVNLLIQCTANGSSTTSGSSSSSNSTTGSKLKNFLEQHKEKGTTNLDPKEAYNNSHNMKKLRPISFSIKNASSSINGVKEEKSSAQIDNNNFTMNGKEQLTNNSEHTLVGNNKKEGQCFCCNHKGHFELAIKEIDVNRKGNEFQFVREQELLCHFNSNVIKPISTKDGNLKEKRNYEILMHCANGDLRKLLQNLIFHRKKEYEKRKRVNKILKLIHIIFGKKYKCYKNEDEHTCVGLCHQKLKKIKMKLNNNVVEIEHPTFDFIYDNIKVYNCGLTESECKFLFFQIVNGISFLQTCYQSNMIRLTDIKLQNILVYTNVHNIYNPLKWHLCISDFGCSAMEYATFHLENSKHSTENYKNILNQWKHQFINQLSSYFQGTVYTMAPEGLCYDYKGNFRQSKYNKLVHFYEQNFGNIDDRFQELQKSSVCVKNSLNNFNIVNINSSTNFCFLSKEGEEEQEEEDEQQQEQQQKQEGKGNSINDSKKEKEKKNGQNKKDISKRKNLNHQRTNVKNKNNDGVSNEKYVNNERNKSNGKINSNENNKKTNNNSTEYLPFDVRCDSWSLGIILADLGKCGIGSYEYIISEKSSENCINNVWKNQNVDLNSIILADLNLSKGEEVFYLKCIMNYYDIVTLEWDNECLENENLKKNGETKDTGNSSKGEDANNEMSDDADVNVNDQHNDFKSDNINENTNICNNNKCTDKGQIKKISTSKQSGGRDIGSRRCSKDLKEKETLHADNSNDSGKQNNRGNNSSRKNHHNKDEEKNHMESNNRGYGKKNKRNDNNFNNLELFTSHYKLFILKFKDYIKIDKVAYIKNEFVKYYKMNKHLMNKKNIEKKILFLFLIINNNLTYNFYYELQSFFRIELTVKNIGSGIFKFRNKKEKEKYLQDFKLNIQKEHMNGNKEYWHSRLTNKYLAIILKDVCHENFSNRKKNIKKCYNKFEYPLNYSDDYWNLLTDLLNYVPYERLLACEIIGHDFFSEPNEKIKNIPIAENAEDYVDLLDKKEFMSTIWKNYIRERKEKKYICNPFHEEFETEKEIEAGIDSSDKETKLYELGGDKMNSRNCVANGGEKRGSTEKGKEKDMSKTNRMSANEKNFNQQKRFIMTLYDIILKNVKNRCDFCDSISDCLNYKNILKKIDKLESCVLNVKDKCEKNIKNGLIKKDDIKKKKFLYPSNVCNNVYYFLNEASIFLEFTNLDVFMNMHLPFEHLYLPLCDEKTDKNKFQVNFFFKPIYFYSFPYKIIHAWYTGPLHIYLKHPSIPDYINRICLRESNILRRKEIIFWFCEDIILKSVSKIKKLLNCSNDFLCTPYVSHIIGKQLIIRKQYLLKLLNGKSAI